MNRWGIDSSAVFLLLGIRENAPEDYLACVFQSRSILEMSDGYKNTLSMIHAPAIINSVRKERMKPICKAS